MKQYQQLLRLVMRDGVDKGDRTGTGTKSLFGPVLHFDLLEGFPIVTTKKIFFKGVMEELLWFLKGDTNIKYLQDRGVKIWDEWADEKGDLGPVYGKQWRSWDGYGEGVGSIDQIANVIDLLKIDPDSRRIVVNAWNVGDLEDMALTPCHMMFQFYSRKATNVDRERWALYNASQFGPEGSPFEMPDRVLSCQMYQRSADMFLGVPFNIASYALLTHMIAQVTNHIPGTFQHMFGDAHVYNNHFDQVTQQLKAVPQNLPKLKLNPTISNIDDFIADDIELIDYIHLPTIKAPVAV